MTAAVQFDKITCTFASKSAGASYTAVKDVDLAIADGEFVSVVGPTGCGKSTLLNVAAGLLKPSSGAVRIFGEPLGGINSRAGYMFQAEALMPWRNALRNVTAGLEFRGVEMAEARRRGE
ncbi:MAG TPA: ATP-binding cassette domain-containing protein, partial [Usitatibacter sp.]